MEYMKYFEILKHINNWDKSKKPKGKVRLAYVSKLLKQKDSTNISAVIGVRRSGKSTILNQVLFDLINNYNVNPKNTLYINFEDPRLNDLLIDNNIFDFLAQFNQRADKRSKRYYFFDEIQNLQNWEAILRTILDTDKHTKIYITGSSANLLGRELGTKLTGRYIKTEVFPLSWQEFQLFTKSTTQEFIHNGGFPDVVLSVNKELKNQILIDYFESILLKDISNRYAVRNDFKLKRLALQLFTNISNKASSYRLTHDLGVATDTIFQYFSYIEDAYLGFFVSKYADSIRKQEYNPKKFYAIDNGLQGAVAYRVIDDFAKLFENAIFLELRRNTKEIYYWEEKQEVDFVTKIGDSIDKIINVSVNIDKKATFDREISALVEAMYSLQKNKSYLVTLDSTKKIIKTEVGEIEIVSFSDLDWRQ
jgi:uncharacterized protein